MKFKEAVKNSTKVATAPRESAAARAELDALPVATANPVARPTHEQISVRAYYIFLLTGSQHGHCQDNWHQAEREFAGKDGASVWARDGGHEHADPEYHPANPMIPNAHGSMPANKVAGI
ncbi:MAG TPA: DUF2934 domain-containing protein [Planctomycetota bacterium]|nr:DUF2934 domain-containing protein [Planctomycetota bacterium]